MHTAFVVAILGAVIAPTSLSAAGVCKAPKLRQGMSYSLGKRAILKAGFQSQLPPAQGYRKEDQKVVSECAGNVNMCNEYPEIDSCNGQGGCNMLFTDIYRNKLSVYVKGFGEIDNRGPKNVAGFEIECVK